jgi:hypothetical protein
VTKHSRKHTQLVAEVLFSDGSVWSNIAVPFQQPQFQNVQAALANINPDGSFDLLFTASHGKKRLTSLLPL